MSVTTSRLPARRGDEMGDNGSGPAPELALVTGPSPHHSTSPRSEPGMSMPPTPHIAHGTWAGYNLGCRHECCREAARLYQKRRVLDAERGRPRRVSSLGTRRRIEALACLGWDMYAIAREVGTGRETVRQWTTHATVYRTTHERMVAVYDRLSMRLPVEETASQKANAAKARNKARRLGWAPPLAWDDIDDPTERPKFGNRQKRRDEVDEAVVDRFLCGEYDLHTSVAERREIARRWAAATGLSLAELERRTGWKPERYVKVGVAA